MLKICGSTTYRPLEIIFKEALSTGLFPSEWKKENIVPVHKKGGKQVLKRFNEMFSFLLKNNLVSPKQSGFKPGDS